MSRSVKKALKEEYNRLRKIFDRLVKPKKEQGMPSWVLQPVKDKRQHLRNY